MMATGTGIAPFISLLRDPFTYDYFNKIHVSWTVRKKKDLESYDSFLREMDVNYFPTVTQEEFENKGRIQSFIDKKQFFQDTSPNNDKVMICGSLNFNDDIKNLLLQKGWEEGNKKTAGNFVVEKAFVGEGVN
jgi:ferredoxin--NADP+ reductase